MPLLDQIVIAAVSIVAIIVVAVIVGIARPRRAAEVLVADTHPLGHDDHLIAVIAAAVASASGAPASSFRIASVERVGSFSTPVWGYVNRTDGSMRRLERR